MMANMDILTTERFEDLAMAYGGTLARWPDAERARAEAFCAAHPEGEAILAEARMLDAALDGLDVPAPSEALMTRILGDAADVAAERAAETPRPAVRRAPKPRFSFGFGRISRWAPGMALAASLALGVGVGASGAVETTPADAVLAIVAPDTATDTEGGMSLVLVSDDASEDDLFLGSGAFL